MSAMKRSAGPATATAAAIGAVALAAVLTGCARPGQATGQPGTTLGTSASATDPSSPPQPTAGTSPPPLSATDLPTGAPTGPPQQPTDQLPTDIVVGQVTAVAGSCYAVLTGDDKVYALYGTGVHGIARGDTVRVKIKPLTLKINCGPGQHAQIVSISVVG